MKRRRSHSRSKISSCPFRPPTITDILVLGNIIRAPSLPTCIPSSRYGETGSYPSRRECRPPCHDRNRTTYRPCGRDRSCHLPARMLSRPMSSAHGCWGLSRTRCGILWEAGQLGLGELDTKHMRFGGLKAVRNYIGVLPRYIFEELISEPVLDATNPEPRGTVVGLSDEPLKAFTTQCQSLR
jgi:hypothetical protein